MCVSFEMKNFWSWAPCEGAFQTDHLEFMPSPAQIRNCLTLFWGPYLGKSAQRCVRVWLPAGGDSLGLSAQPLHQSRP